MNKRIRFQSRLNRRSFLQRTGMVAAAAFAGPLIVPGRVLGLEGTTAPSNRITIGFIGTGRQAVHANIPGFINEDDAQAVAVCDVDSWRMEQAKKQIEDFYAGQTASGNYKGCATFKDWRDLLARKDIDAVMISTPDHWHALMAIAAANAGKDIACEKPLTRSIAEGRKLADAVSEKKIVFRTDSEYRSRKFYFQAVQLVRNGKIGKLQRITTGMRPDPTLGPQPDMPVPSELDYDMWLGPAPQAAYTEKRVHNQHDTKSRPGWMCIRDYDDGMLANWGAHLHDMALWAMNLDRSGPTEIEGTGKYPPSENLWNVIQDFEVHFAFANGVQLTSKTDTTAYIRFEGTEGWIHVHDSGSIEAEPKSLLQWKPGPNDLALTYKRSEKRDFLDCVKSRGQTQEDAEIGHRNSTLCHLALAAIDLKRKIKWNPEKEQVIGDAEVTKHLKPKPYRSPWKL